MAEERPIEELSREEFLERNRVNAARALESRGLAFGKSIALFSGGLSIVAVILWLFMRQLPLLIIAISFLLVVIAAGVQHLLHRRGWARAGVFTTLGALLLCAAAVFVLLPEARIGVLLINVYVVFMAGGMILDPSESPPFIWTCIILLIVDIILVGLVPAEYVVQLNQIPTLAVTIILALISLGANIRIFYDSAVGGQTSFGRGS